MTAAPFFEHPDEAPTKSQFDARTWFKGNELYWQQLPRVAVQVLSAVLTFCPDPKPSRDKLARQLRTSRSSVKRGLRMLEECGLITIWSGHGLAGGDWFTINWEWTPADGLPSERPAASKSERVTFTSYDHMVEELIGSGPFGHVTKNYIEEWREHWPETWCVLEMRDIAQSHSWEQSRRSTLARNLLGALGLVEETAALQDDVESALDLITSGFEHLGWFPSEDEVRERVAWFLAEYPDEPRLPSAVARRWSELEAVPAVSLWLTVQSLLNDLEPFDVKMGWIPLPASGLIASHGAAKAVVSMLHRAEESFPRIHYDVVVAAVEAFQAQRRPGGER